MENHACKETTLCIDNYKRPTTNCITESDKGKAVTSTCRLPLVNNEVPEHSKTPASFHGNKGQLDYFLGAQ